MNNLSSNETSLPPSKEQACSSPIQEIWLGLTVFLIFVMIITFIGNLLVLLAVIFFRRLRSITNYFIVSLAVSDLFIALLSLPFRIHQNRHNGNWCLSLEACQTWIVVDSICSMASIWNLTIISIDRFIAIRRPFQYHSLITTKVGLGMISSVWTYSLFLSLMIFINWTKKDAPHFTIKRECGNEDPVYLTVVVSLSFFLPLMIVLVMYGLVFEVALNQTRAMAALQVDMGRGRGGRRSSINMIREVKAAKTLAVVVGCFIICWLPFNILLMVVLWRGELFAALHPNAILGISLVFVYILPALNSTMNPIIYALFNREFRSAFMKLAKRISGRRLGAVGYDGTMEESVSANSTFNDNKSHSKSLRFQEQSNNTTPTIARHNVISHNNDGHLKPEENNDSYSMETTIDENKNSDQAAFCENVNNEVVENNTTITHGTHDVVQDSLMIDLPIKLPPLETKPKINNDQGSSDLPVVKASTTLPPIDSSASQSNESENETLANAQENGAYTVI